MAVLANDPGATAGPTPSAGSVLDQLRRRALNPPSQAGGELVWNGNQWLPASPSGPTNTTSLDKVLGASALKWFGAIVALWWVLTLMADVQDTAELAEAFAVLVLFTVLMLQGPQALANLGFLSGGTAGGSS